MNERNDTELIFSTLIKQCHSMISFKTLQIQNNQLEIKFNKLDR